VDGCVVVVENGDVVILLREIGSQGGAHLACPYDENFQNTSAFPNPFAETNARVLHCSLGYIIIAQKGPGCNRF
jgi:hypothetical protein